MRPPRVIAIDFGAERVTCGTFAQGATGRLVLERFACEPLRGDTWQIERWTTEAVRALDAIATRENLRGRVVVALPGHGARTKHVVTPAVRKEKRSSVLAFEATESFPLPLEELTWDSVLLEDDGLDLRAILAAAKREPLRAICAAGERTGLAIERAVPSVFALLHGFRCNHPETRESAIVVDVGARSTDVALIDGKRFAFRSFALGGGFATQAIANDLGIDFGRAETLKRRMLQQPSELTADATARAAVERAGEMLVVKLQAELARTIFHLRRQTDAAAPAAMFLTGGVSSQPGLAEALGRKLGLPVRSCDSLRNVDVAANARASGADAMPETLASLVGLAAQHLRSAVPVVNLLPASVIAAAAERRRRSWMLAAAAAIVLAFFAAGFGYHRRAVAHRSEIARLEAQIRPLQAIESRLVRQREELERTRRQIESLRFAYETRTSWLDFFSDLQARLVRVEDLWLDKLEIVRGAMDPDESDADGRTAGRLRLTLSGRSLDVANPQARVSRAAEERVKQLLRSFGESPYVAAVEKEQFDDRQHGLLRFDFTLALKPQKPL